MNKKQIATLVRAYTDGSMNIEGLRGPAKKFARVDLLKQMGLGVVDSGISDLYIEIYAFYDIDGTCAAHMQLKLIEALRDALVDKEVAE